MEGEYFPAKQDIVQLWKVGFEFPATMMKKMAD
jgi:hypothetical protein